MNAIQVYALLNKKINASATSISNIEITSDNKLKFTMADGRTFLVNLPIKANCLDFKVVSTLPSSDISASTIYFVPVPNHQGAKRYLQYMYIENAWECLGDNTFDISNYYTKSEVDNLINNSRCPIASKTQVGLVKPDDDSIKIDANGTISVSKIYIESVVKDDSSDIGIDNSDITKLF